MTYKYDEIKYLNMTANNDKTINFLTKTLTPVEVEEYQALATIIDCTRGDSNAPHEVENVAMIHRMVELLEKATSITNARALQNLTNSVHSGDISQAAKDLGTYIDGIIVQTLAKK